jgi:hypothetical protein
MIRQVEQDRLNLSELVGYEVVGFAYPGGGVNHDDRTAEIIRKNTGIRYCRTNASSYSFDIQDDMYLFKPTISFLKEKERTLQLCEEFIDLKPNDIKLFYIWGHSYEMDINDDWGFAEDVLKMLGGRDDILYCTNTEAFEYIKKFCK